MAKISKSATNQKMVYYPYQNKMIDDMIQSESPYLYNASEMGLGKTIITYGYMYNMGFENTLVVCMANLRLNWLRESFWGGPNVKNGVAILSNKDLDYITQLTQWKPGYHPPLLIVSYDMLVTNYRLLKYVRSRKWDFVVADEFHNCRNLAAKKTEIMQEVLSKVDSFKLLSGTPLVNSGADIFTALNLIVPRLPHIPKHLRNMCKDFDTFAGRYAYKSIERNGVVYKRTKNPDELKALIKNYGYFFRNLKKDVLPDLPDKFYRHIELDCDAGIKVDPELRKKLMVLYDTDPEKAAALAKTIPSLAKQRRVSGEDKAASPEFFEYCCDILNTNVPIVLFAYHKNVINLLMQKYKKWNPVKLDGDTSPRLKQKAVDDFQSGKSDVFIGQVQAAGAGITLTRAQDCVFYEYDWVPSTILQCVDRLHRIGQKGSVTAHLPTSNDPLDIHVIKTFIKKQKYIDKVI